jgi:hypothetical protein
MNQLPREARWSLLAAIALGLFLAGLGVGDLFVTQRLNPTSSAVRSGGSDSGVQATDSGTSSSVPPSGCGPGATATSGCGPAIVAGPVQLYTNGNGGGVTPGATAPSRFTVTSGPVRITELKTYHYFRPDGLPSAGTISLLGSDGTVYGPWQTTGSPGAVKHLRNGFSG